MWLALIVVIGVTLGRMIWVCAADVLAFGRENKPVTITVYESDTMDSITDKLYDAGLIRYKSLFNFYADISHAEKKIDPGIYDLNTRYDYHALVNMMSASSTAASTSNSCFSTCNSSSKCNSISTWSSIFNLIVGRLSTV